MNFKMVENAECTIYVQKSDYGTPSQKISLCISDKLCLC